MTVSNLSQWQARPGRLNETLANAAAAKQIFEKLGAQVRAYQPLVAGPTTANHLGFVTEFETMAAYAKFVAAVRTNEQWLQLNQNAVLSAEPAATMVNSILSTTTPGLEMSGPAAKGAGPRVVVATMVQPMPGREADVVAGLTELAPIVTKLGARFTARNVLAGGPAAGQVSIVIENDDLAAFGTMMDKLLASAAYQGWLAKYRSTNPPSTVISRSVVLQVL